MLATQMNNVTPSELEIVKQQLVLCKQQDRLLEEIKEQVPGPRTIRILFRQLEFCILVQQTFTVLVQHNDAFQLPKANVM